LYVSVNLGKNINQKSIILFRMQIPDPTSEYSRTHQVEYFDNPFH
jgi:hypothetical protein